MKDRIRPPVKVDEQKKVIRDPKKKPRWWRLNVPASITGKKKERRFFATEQAAKDYAADVLENHRRLGADTKARLKERNMSLTEAIEYALRHAPKTSAVSFSEAFTAFVAARRKANRKKAYLENLESQFERLSGRFGKRLVHEIVQDELDAWLDKLKGKDGKSSASSKTRTNYIITLTAFFNFCVDRGWRGANPAEKLVRAEEDEKPTTILTPKQCKCLIEEGAKSQHREVFAAMLVQLYAGPRRSELLLLKWEHVIGKYLRLDRSKCRVKRAVEMPEVLQRWLAIRRKNAGAIFAGDGGEDGYTYRLNQIAEAAKVPLPRNVLRHTAISVRVAATGDIEGTSLWAGNSPGIIREHYLGTMTPEDAATIYSFGPKDAANVIPIEVGA